jgi:hypothetical protein
MKEIQQAKTVKIDDLLNAPVRGFTMTKVQQEKRKSKAQEKTLRLREEFWPELKENDVWDRKKQNGYTTVPRTMPLLMAIIDSLSKNQPAGQAYFVLWCHVFDESVLTIENPEIFASETGFSGERKLSTWKQRMKTLQELGFIDAKKGGSGDYHYVLIPNPHVVVRKLKNRIPESLYRQLYDRAFDIGAKDMVDHE